MSEWNEVRWRPIVEEEETRKHSLSKKMTASKKGEVCEQVWTMTMKREKPEFCVGGENIEKNKHAWMGFK